MKTLNSNLKAAAMAAVMLLLSACITNPGTDDEPGYCPDENRVLLDGNKYCVMSQMIIEKGFDCPPDLGYRHDIPETNGAVCSDNPVLPPADEDPLRDLILNPPQNNDPWLNNNPEPGNNTTPVNNTTPGNNTTPVNNNTPQCSSPDPSAQPCSEDADCGAGEVCGFSATQECVPSSCFCDETTDSWGCTADCGQRRACVPEGTSTCDGPDPSAQECDVDADCADGQACVDSDIEVCVPSSCSCTPDGQWVCTEDCGTPRTCADVSDTCNGTPDPSAQGCGTDADCAAGQVCADSGDDVCIPSSCFCDPEGGWGCTEDCNAYFECQDPDTNPETCNGEPDPSAQPCQADSDCTDGAVCGFSATQECVPSSCFCDPAGGWGCTDDCNQRRACVPGNTMCMPGETMQPECFNDADCPGENNTCVVIDANACVPSGCSCDENGQWLCTADCQPERACSQN